MTRTLRIQGLLFDAVALALSAASLVLPRPAERVELVVFASLTILLGVPHGALDPIFAKRLYRVGGLRGWMVFGSVYSALAAAVVGLWLIAPGLFLAGFLAISVAHFSGDPPEGTAPASRLLYGGVIVVLPARLHAAELEHLFGFLTGPEAAARLTHWLSWLAWPWMAGLVLAAIYQARSEWLTGLEMLAAGLVALVAPPLVAFAVFFCGMHGARHILRTVAYAKDTAPRQLVAMISLPMAAVMAATLAGWLLLGDRPVDARLLQVVIVGLAALTVPHMALIEPVRLSGWSAGRVPLRVSVVK